MSNDGAALDPMRATRVDGDRDGREATGQCQRGRSFWYNGSMTDPQRGVMRPPVSAESVIRFGRHRGRLLVDLDDGYLYWLVRRAGLYDSTREVIRDELRRRARQRRSWRPVIRALYGRQLLGVFGRGCYAVIERCGADRRELTVKLYETAEQAQAQREQDCGFEGPWGCEAQRHVAVDLRDWTLLRRSTVPGEAIE